MSKEPSLLRHLFRICKKYILRHFIACKTFSLLRRYSICLVKRIILYMETNKLIIKRKQFTN